MLKQKELLKARSRIWAAGFVLVRVDRNPGRVIAICRELWVKLQRSTFLENTRYQRTGLRPYAEYTGYTEGFLTAGGHGLSGVARS
jgi:hypothetical protein